MTWGEFKALVEAKGVKDDTPVFCIVVDSWSLLPVHVAFGKDGSVNITVSEP